jgi:hypothetical protein
LDPNFVLNDPTFKFLFPLAFDESLGDKKALPLLFPLLYPFLIL